MIELTKIFNLDSIPGETEEEIRDNIYQLEQSIEAGRLKIEWLRLCPHLQEFIKFMHTSIIEIKLSAYDGIIDAVCTKCGKIVPSSIKWYKE